jgi:hypothetical protein
MHGDLALPLVGGDIPKYLWVLPVWTFICPEPSLNILSYSTLSQAIVSSITAEDS